EDARAARRGAVREGAFEILHRELVGGGLGEIRLGGSQDDGSGSILEGDAEGAGEDRLGNERAVLEGQSVVVDAGELNGVDPVERIGIGVGHGDVRDGVKGVIDIEGVVAGGSIVVADVFVGADIDAGAEGTGDASLVGGG